MVYGTLLQYSNIVCQACVSNLDLRSKGQSNSECLYVVIVLTKIPLFVYPVKIKHGSEINNFCPKNDDKNIFELPPFSNHTQLN